MNLRAFLLLASLEVFFLAHKACCFNGFPNCSTPLKEYKVKSSGNDSQECLSMLQPCANLKYILEMVVPLVCVVIELQDPQILSRKYELFSASNLAIIGNAINSPSVHISCERNSGIYFESSQQVHLEKLDFVDCAVVYPSTETDDLIAGLYFHHGANVSITNCSLNNGVIIKDVIGEIRLTSTSFIGNKQTSTEFISLGLFIYRLDFLGTVKYSIDDCLFEGNDVRHRSVSYFGGGLTFIHNVSASTSFLTILNTRFNDNQGVSGGGLHISHGSTITTSSYVEVAVSDCKFQRNTAVYEGGGLWITNSNSTSSSVTAVYITDTLFIDNSALWGGGLAVFSSTGNITVVAKNSMWVTNYAGTSGTGVGFFVTNNALHPSRNRNHHSIVTGTFQNCSFHGNTNKGLYTKLTVVGAVYAGQARIDFINSTFSGNNGTALYLRQSAYATFSGNVIFEHNLGIHGSAIHIAYDSIISLEKEVHLYFLNNTAAFERGGAIFDDKYFDVDLRTPCIFESLYALLQSTGNYSVTFSNNLAHGKLQSVYVSDPRNCFKDASNASSGCLLYNSKIFRYIPDTPRQIASPGYSIKLCTIPNLTDRTLQIMPGEHFYIDPIVLDVFGNPSSLHGYLVLVHNNQIRKYNGTMPLRLVGPDYMAMDTYTKNNPFYIAGTYQNHTWSVAFIYDNSEASYRDGSQEFLVNLVDCRPGFLYNSSTQTCNCGKDQNLVCPSSSIACVRREYWYGSSGVHLAVLPCEQCDYNSKKCFDLGCEKSPGFCRLDDNHSQCVLGRTGTLCSYCQTNYSFTFSALYCVESKGCSSGYFFLSIFIVLLYWIIFILFVFLILSLNLGVGSGFMYGIVYYFSVIYMYTRDTIRNRTLATLVHTCVAITQLCPHVIGNIKICFVESLKWNLNHKIYHYVTPIFVSIVILFAIWLSQFCRCPKRLSLAQNSPIHAIALLILFSYSSLAFVSFEILKPIKIYNETMVYIDPDLKYFHKPHLPYALTAIFMELFVILPICFLLLFEPLLSRRLNLVKLKLKPIVDDFQASYRPECRWFAGFYFLARQLVYIANTIPQITGEQSLPPQENIIFQYLNAVILIVHVSFQPYKLKWLNVLDTLLLSDILIISFININLPFTFQKVSLYILIFCPSLYLLGALIILIARRIQLSVKPFCSKHANVWVNEKMWTNADRHFRGLPTQSTVLMDNKDDYASTSSVDPRCASLVDSFYTDDGVREPLLSDSRSSLYKYDKNKTNDTFTTSSLRLSSVERFPPSLPYRNPNKAATN